MEGVDGGPSEGGASGGSDDQPQPRTTEANVRGRGPAGGDRAEPALPSPPVTSPQPKRSMCWSSGHPAATASSLPVVTSPQPPRLRCWRSKLARSDSSRRDNNTAELYSLFFILYSFFFLFFILFISFFFAVPLIFSIPKGKGKGKSPSKKPTGDVGGDGPDAGAVRQVELLAKQVEEEKNLIVDGRGGGATREEARAPRNASKSVYIRGICAGCSL